MAQQFTHLDASGNPNMVDVGEKEQTKRLARAQAIVVLDDFILEKLENEEIHTKKGPVFQTAILAGIMAAKKTGELIPLCHPLMLDAVNLNIHINDLKEVVIECSANITGKTGVEMEALTAVNVALLTVYDMCKAVDRGMTITGVKLLEKHGGKSGSFVAQAQ